MDRIRNHTRNNQYSDERHRGNRINEHPSASRGYGGRYATGTQRRREVGGYARETQGRGNAGGYPTGVQRSSGAERDMREAQGRGNTGGYPTGVQRSSGAERDMREARGHGNTGGYPTGAQRSSGAERDMREARGRSNAGGYPNGTQRRRGTEEHPRSRYQDKQPHHARYSRTSRRRGRGSRKSLYICLVVILVLLLVGGVGTAFLYRNRGNGVEQDIAVGLDSLDSPHAVLIDGKTGRIIGSKNAEAQIFPASMVKIMTVLTAIEQIKDLDETITMSYDYYDMLYERDASRAGFEPGEEAVVRDLLYGALLPSGAECCMELALQAAGSESAFVELMNQKAAELGLTQTQFMNCTGLHDDSQYSTVTEIAEILRAALDNRTFYKVFTTKDYTVKPTQVHPDGFTFQSSMFKGMQSPTVIGGEIMGGKTGYTDDAGHCLASMAEVDGREYILVTAGWAQNPRVDQYHINDAFLAYNALGRAIEDAKGA